MPFWRWESLKEEQIWGSGGEPGVFTALWAKGRWGYDLRLFNPVIEEK